MLPPSFRNLTLLVCTLLKSTVFCKLVRQSCLRESGWDKSPPPPSLALSHLSYIPQVSVFGTETVYFMLSSVFFCFVLFCLKYLSLSAGLIFIKKKQRNPLESFFIILQGGRSIKNNLLLQYINIVQMHWSQTEFKSLFLYCGHVY